MSVPVRRALSLTMFMSVSAAAIVLAGQAAGPAASAGWVKTPAPGETTAMAFATINNPTMYDVYFTSGTTDAAGSVQLRDKSKGADQKAQTITFIIVPAYGSLAMDQNGVYLLLQNLKRPLKDGETVTLMLSTSDGAKLQVPAAVRKQ